jgi:hypothetical protein
MKVFITGGTGFVGRVLSDVLTSRGHTLTILTRREPPPPDKENLRYLQGDPVKPGEWQRHVPGNDVIINLAGASIFTRWTKSAKKRIIQSRIDTTRNLVDAVEKGSVLMSTSAIGYYGFRGDEMITETEGPGNDFLAELTKQWEAIALSASSKDVRVFIMRFGIVLGKRGGMLKMMVPIFKLNLASPLGSGKQWISWIHEEDLANIFLFLMEKEDEKGIINCTAPNPVQNRQFIKTLAKVMGKWTFMPPVPALIIRIILGELGSVLLNGQRVIPQRLMNMGFSFKYPQLDQALRHLISTE